MQGGPPARCRWARGVYPNPQLPRGAIESRPSGGGQEVADGLEGPVAPGYPLHVPGLDQGVLDEQVVVDAAAVQVAGALHGDALPKAHGVVIAARHDHP